MTAHVRIHFVVADGAHARWVERSGPASDFKTLKEMRAGHKATGHPQGVAFEGSSGQRFSIEEKHDAVRHHEESFARDVASAINSEAGAGAFDRLAIVAPARTLGAITEHLNHQAKAKLVKTLAKDLVKTPDHDLGKWLNSLEVI